MRSSCIGTRPRSPAVTGRICGIPLRLVAELLAMPTTDGNCCVLSPQSLVSGPVAGQAAKGMRFRVRALHALVGCSSGLRRDRRFADLRFSEVRPEQSPQSAEISVQAPFLRFFPALPRSLARCWSRARRRFDVLLQALRVWVSSNKFLAQRARSEISCRSLRRKHISALGAGHLASLRARVSRGSSGQKPTWRKSSWYFTKTPSA